MVRDGSDANMKVAEEDSGLQCRLFGNPYTDMHLIDVRSFSKLSLSPFRACARLLTKSADELHSVRAITSDICVIF